MGIFKNDITIRKIDEVPKIIFSLQRTSGRSHSTGPWKIESVTITTPTFENKIYFKRKSNCCEVFKSDIWHLIERYLPPTQDAHVMTAPDVCWSSNQITMQSLYVTGFKKQGDTQYATASFQVLIGNVKALFHENQFPDPLCDVGCQLSTRALNNILLPALNLISIDIARMSQNNFNILKEFIEGLQEKKYEIEFYTSLIMRMIAANDSKRMDEFCYSISEENKIKSEYNSVEKEVRVI